MQYKFGSVKAYSLLSQTVMHLVNPPEFGITIVSNFSRVLHSSQEKSKTMVKQGFLGGEGGGRGVNKVHYSLCENSKYRRRPNFRLTCVTQKRLEVDFH